MPHYEVPWHRWMLEEEIIATWFLSRGLETPDVADIMAHRLRSRIRDKRVIILYMDNNLNPKLARSGYPRLCTPGMLDWDKDAVDDFLIRMTNDTYLLRDLLRFGHDDIRLLQTYHKSRIPLEEVFDLRGLQYELETFLRKHRSFWGSRYPRGRDRFF